MGAGSVVVGVGVADEVVVGVSVGSGPSMILSLNKYRMIIKMMMKIATLKSTSGSICVTT